MHRRAKEGEAGKSDGVSTSYEMCALSLYMHARSLLYVLYRL